LSHINAHHVAIAGLSEPGKNERRLYVREEWKANWTVLNTENNINFQGPPGTGKSTLTWVWCCWKAKQGTKLLWVHFTKLGQDVVYLENDKLDVLTGNMEKEAARVLEVLDPEIVIYDGVTSGIQEKLLILGPWWKRNTTKRRFIIVSSMQFKMSLQDQENSNLTFLMSYGWRLEEYRAACGDLPLKNTLKLGLDYDTTLEAFDEKLTAKYYLAGESALWMFRPTEVANREIEDSIKSANNHLELVKGLQGDRSLLTANHLVTTIRVNNENCSMLTSEYITKKLVQRFEIQFLTELTRFSSKQPNTSFDGWVFQMDFLKRVELASKKKELLRLTKTGGKNEDWKVEHYHEYREPEELEGFDLKTNSWFIPTKINQGCFDALQLLVPKKRQAILRVVQIAVAKTHSLKLRFIVPVLKALKIITNLEVVTVVPLQNEDIFKVNWGESEDDKLLEIKNLNWKRGSERILGFKRLGED
jgi:hypothetical protein